MPTLTKSYRFQLPAKAVKGDCLQCAPRHRRTLSRYIDTQMNEPLPDEYGRCDRESNCGYHLSPYHKGSSGASYAEQINPRTSTEPIPKAWFRMAGKQKSNGIPRLGLIQTLTTMEGATLEQAEKVAAFIYDKPVALTKQDKPAPVVCSIPEEVFQSSLGHYNHNKFARLLAGHLGAEVAQAILQRYQVGTSSLWPGACVFWYIDEQNRKRGGQIKLFGDDWHTVKYVDQNGEKRSKTSWVHSALAHRYKATNEPIPDWLTTYEQHAERSPCLFGLPQLTTAPVDQPIAIVEAPKTAILCSHYFPDFIWVAVGGKSYLNAERLAPLKGRRISLFPDLNAYFDLVNEKGQVNKGWLTKAKELQAHGFDITVSDYLEQQASDEDRAKGLDLADYLLGSASVDTPVENEKRIDVIVREEVLPIKLPKSLLYKWSLFGHPPLWFNKIAAHKALQHCLEPEDEPAPLEPPVALTKPREDQIERLVVEPCDSYPPAWDSPTPPDAVPTIKPLSFFEWQRQSSSSFSQLGLASLNKPLQP